MMFITANELLFQAGKCLHSLNPSLLPYPPPSKEQTGNDVCFLGPAGEDDHDFLVYCRDLPDGQRGTVASWYLHPERHIIEYIFVVTGFYFIIRSIVPSLPRYPESSAHLLMPPLSVKILTFFMLTCQIIYKVNGYSGKILMMLMPCNVLWVLWAILCFCPNLGIQKRFIMYQIMINFSSLAIAAVATPDLSDLTMWLEVPFFFIMHYTLIGFPIYLLGEGTISVLPIPGCNETIVSNFFKWWILSCAFFGVFYFGIATPLSIVTGVNLNYMMHPPPTPGDLISGENFRLFSTLAVASVFFLIRFLFTIWEFVGFSMSKLSSRTKKCT